MDKPNILLITSDQQHWDTIGAFNSEIETPNLDRLVDEGTTFSRAYCPNPTCTPSRSSMITGMYPSQHGAYSLGTKLSEDVKTIGDYLQEGGYNTGLVGKAHFQPLKSTEKYKSLEAYPILQDLDFWKTFDEDFYGFQDVDLTRNHVNEAHVGQHYAIWLEEKGLDNWKDYFVPPTGTMDPNHKYKWEIPTDFHYNAWIAERVNSRIEEYKEDEKPFFLWASFFDPHPPYLVPEPWDTLYDPDSLTLPKLVPGEHEKNPPHFQLTQETNPDFSDYIDSDIGNIGFRSHANITEETQKRNIAVYYGMVSMLDDYVGKILDNLDKHNLTDDTIIVFTSDHGHFFGQHGLHDKGGFHYEDVLKLPFIVRYPKQVPAGKTSSALQSLVDLAPTFLSYANLPIPPTMTGVNQKDVWSGTEEKVRDHIISENRSQPTALHMRTYVDERYKITLYYGEIFDLEEDPKELNNLWDDPDKSELKTNLLLKYAWAELLKEPMSMPRISGA